MAPVCRRPAGCGPQWLQPGNPRPEQGIFEVVASSQSLGYIGKPDVEPFAIFLTKEAGGISSGETSELLLPDTELLAHGGEQAGSEFPS